MNTDTITLKEKVRLLEAEIDRLEEEISKMKPITKATNEREEVENSWNWI